MPNVLMPSIFRCPCLHSPLRPLQSLPPISPGCLPGLRPTRPSHTAPLPLRKTGEDYIAAQHAGSGLSLETTTASQAAQFDTEMQALLFPFAKSGLLTFHVVGGITWGRPLSGEN